LSSGVGAGQFGPARVFGMNVRVSKNGIERLTAAVKITT